MAGVVERPTFAQRRFRTRLSPEVVDWNGEPRKRVGKKLTLWLQEIVLHNPACRLQA